MTPHNTDKETKAYVGLQNPAFPPKWKDRFGSWDGTLDLLGTFRLFVADQGRLG